MSKRFKFIPAVYLVLMSKDGETNNTKVLLTRRFQTGYEDGKYSMIAGHLEGDEPLTTAMIREAQEEAGITLQEKDLTLVHTMHRKSEISGTTDDERVDFYFSASTYEGEIKNLEPHKCDNMEWFSLDNLPENIIPCVKHALEQIKNGSQFSEYGW